MCDVRVRARACKHANSSRHPARRITGALQCRPARFEEYSLLWVHYLGFLGMSAKERGVKTVRVFKNAARGNVLPSTLQYHRVQSRLGKFCITKKGDAFL